ncbi:hypothetical protein ACO0LB_18880 [Undibacterium sp. SXout7W]|uniref:hypothetical protein n=1 Tax=Undibacterium sp. SXout7W TaxID=3413049 RepID=UPI003BF06064
MIAIIYDKTDKGREEIVTRKYHLASRLRTLLVMVDGKQNHQDLLKKVAGLGLNEQHLQELIDQEYISTSIPVISEENLPAIPDLLLEETPKTDQTTAANHVTDAERFQALYNFFNETIKSAIGLRGYGLQLKVEKATSLDDFRELRQPYIEAVLKAKGKETARSFRDRLDQLLYDGQNMQNDTLLKDEPL